MASSPARAPLVVGARAPTRATTISISATVAAAIATRWAHPIAAPPTPVIVAVGFVETAYILVVRLAAHADSGDGARARGDERRKPKNA
jgi:hypothetical protein